MTIVYRPYRPKRARKRKAQAVTIAGPVIVTAKSKRTHQQTAAAVSDEPTKSAIVREAPAAAFEFRRRARHDAGGAQAPGDAADELFREMKRQIAAAKR
jgi:hypothetical protein